MNLNITSQITTSTGLPVTGAYATMDVNTDTIMRTGQVVCKLYVYKDADAATKGLDTVQPVILNGQGNITTRVVGVLVQLTEAEISGPNLPLTIYEKAAAQLSADYGWTVTVSQ